MMCCCIPFWAELEQGNLLENVVVLYPTVNLFADIKYPKVQANLQTLVLNKGLIIDY